MCNLYNLFLSVSVSISMKETLTRTWVRSNPNGGRSGTLIPLYRRRTNLGRASRSIPAIHDFTKQNSLDTHSGGEEMSIYRTASKNKFTARRKKTRYQVQIFSNKLYSCKVLTKSESTYAFVAILQSLRSLPGMCKWAQQLITVHIAADILSGVFSGTKKYHFCRATSAENRDAQFWKLGLGNSRMV